MFAWRSARARAMLAGAVFMLALAAVVGVSVWRAQDMRERHHSLEHRIDIVATLDNARAELLTSTVLLVAATFVESPTSLLVSYRETRLAGTEHLDQARAMLSGAGEMDHLAALDALAEQGDLLQQEVDPVVSIAPFADQETRLAWGRQYFPQMWPEQERGMAVLEEIAGEQQTRLAAEVASADRAAEVSLALVIVLSGTAFLTGAAALIVIIQWVLRPLASLRASVRAIASGNLEARAKVGGPEETASLARDFNEMTQALGERAARLQESERRYRHLFENLNDAAFLADVETGIILDTNKQGEVLLGRSREEIIGMHQSELHPPGKAEEYRQKFATHVEMGRAADHDDEIITRDGSAVPVAISASTMTLEGKHLILGLFRDVSECKRAEEALRASETRYQELFENANDVVYTHDLSGQFISFNKAAERVTGYTRDEAQRANIAHIVAPEHVALARDMIQRKVAGGGTTTYELEIVAKDGHRVPLEVSTRLIYEDGKPVAVQGIARDITERKRAEEALQNSERKLSLRNATANIFLTIPDEEVYVEALRAILEALESEHGIFGFVDEDGALVCPSMTRDAWEQCQIRDKDIRFSREAWGGIWGRALTEKRTLCCNEPLGVPEGHIPIRRALAVPLIHPQEVIGLLLVANKCTDYTERDQQLLEEVAHAIGPILRARLERDRQEKARQRAEEALREQVRRDALTGLLNHGAITRVLRDLRSSGSHSAPCAVAMVDVDGMKAINDTYGHQVGDAVLLAVAAALSKESAVVGRYGGDEFAAILPGADRQAAERYREGVLAALRATALRDPESGASVPVSASIGLATYPAEADRLEELIKLADSAMYAAKRRRPVGTTGEVLPRPIGGALAARLVGEMVPLLTSPGDLDNKLRLVAHRLSVGAGYDGVYFALFAPRSHALAASSAFARVPDELIEAWQRTARIDRAESHPLREQLDRGRLPIIVEDVQSDERIVEGARDLLRTAGLRSALIAPMRWRNELIGSLAVASKRKSAFGPRDAQFLMSVATEVTAIVRMATLVEELQSTSGHLARARAEAVIMLAAAAEARDHTTGLHLQNVRAVTEALARELGYSEEDASELGLAAVLHDIGKVRIPESVLSSISRLAEEEWELMKHHATWGAEFLAGRPGFELAATVAHWHHERWDGSGYPDGLAGEAIPEAATIVSVADAFDAMTSDRPYRAARSLSAAVREIVAYSGKQFSPRVVQALVRLHRRRMLPLPQRQPVAEVAA